MRIIATLVTLVCVAGAGNVLASSAPPAMVSASRSVSIAEQIDAVAVRLDADTLRSTREPLAKAVAAGIEDALRTHAEALAAAPAPSGGASAY